MTDAAPPRREWIGVVILFSCLSLAATWPQMIEPAGVLPHRDAWFNMWRIAWTAHQIAADPAHLFDANIYYPEPLTLAYSDAVLLPALLGAPWRWAGMPTPYVHALLVVSSFVLAGVGAWALARTLTGSAGAGIAAGLIFAFAPFRSDHYMHLELLWSGWMPLTLLALHRAVDRASLRAGAAAGGLFAAQTLSCIYYGVYFATVLIPLTLILSTRTTSASPGRRWLALACALVVAGAVVTPYLAPYRSARLALGERSEGEAAIYSAGPVHYLSATPDNLLYGRFADRTGRPEKRLFPGAVAVLLTIVALWPPIDRRTVAYAAALALAIDLSFGPSGLTFGLLHEYVLPYRGLRAPARAGGVALLMVAVLAAMGWARLERERLARSPRRALLTAAVLCAMAVEYAERPKRFVHAATRPDAMYQWLAAHPGGAVAELPMPDEHGLPLHDAEFAYASTFHWHPLVNGYSGNVPASYIDTIRAMRTFPDDAALDRLRSDGVRYVTVHERFLGTDQYIAGLAAIDRRTDLRRQGAFGEPGNRSAIYEIAPARHD